MDKLKSVFGTFEYLWLPNGFDYEEFKNIETPINEKKVFTYAGTVYSIKEISFINIFVSLEKEIRDSLVLRFVGNIHDDARKYLDSLECDCIEVVGRVSKEEYMSYLVSTDFLIFSLNKIYDQVMPSRLAEYMASKKPIIAFMSDESFSYKILSKFKMSFIFNSGEEEKAKRFIIKAIEGRIDVKADEDYIARFEWANISGRLAKALEEAGHG